MNMHRGVCLGAVKKLVLGAVFALLMVGPSDYIGYKAYAGERIDTQAFYAKYNQLEKDKLSLAVEHFQNLVEWALVLRQQTIWFANELKRQQVAGEPLSGEDLQILYTGIADHLKLRKEMYKVVHTYQSWAEKSPEVAWLIDEPTRFKGSLLALAGALVLYDNFAMSVMAYQDDKKLRRIVNKGDKGYGIAPDVLRKVLAAYHDDDSRDRVRETLAWRKQRRLWLNAQRRHDKQLAYLDVLIEQSPSVSRIQEDNRFIEYARLLGLFADKGRDHFASMKDEAVHEASKFFGNTVGLVQTRHGKLYGNARVVADLKTQLKPLDVLLERTPFRLTAQFIPGYFGHVAIWVGTPAEIKAMGLWDHPLVKPHQHKLAAGKGVLEALRPGVMLNTMEHFMDVDDVAILRPEGLSESETRAAMLRAFRQVGKAYDFNFNVETPDTIVCSELAYMVYTHTVWPTERLLGRSTISPDNVARLAGEGTAFSVVSFYQDGKSLGADRTQRFIQALTSEQ